MLAVLKGGMQRGADIRDGHKTELVKLLESICHNASKCAVPHKPAVTNQVSENKNTKRHTN